jgi:predicted RNA-binding protein with RPS1 domain
LTDETKQQDPQDETVVADAAAETEATDAETEPAEKPEAATPAEEEPAEAPVAAAEPTELQEPASEPASEPAAAEADAEPATADTSDEPDGAVPDAPAVEAEAVADEAPSAAVAEADAAPEPEAASVAEAAAAEPEVPMTMAELLDLPDVEVKSPKHGDVVEGTVVRIDPDEILVDFGGKSEGVVSNRELMSRRGPREGEESRPDLNIGDEVLVYVLQPESPEGHAILSLRRAGLERKWRAMQERFDAGEIVEARVIDTTRAA